MIIEKFREELRLLQDIKCRDLQIRIITTVKPETIIGVRMPELRKMAKQFGADEEIGAFLNDQPHVFPRKTSCMRFLFQE